MPTWILAFGVSSCCKRAIGKKVDRTTEENGARFARYQGTIAQVLLGAARQVVWSTW